MSFSKRHFLWENTVPAGIWTCNLRAQYNGLPLNHVISTHILSVCSRSDILAAAVLYGVDNVVKESKAKFNGWMEKGYRIPPNLREVVYYAGEYRNTVQTPPGLDITIPGLETLKND